MKHKYKYKYKYAKYIELCVCVCGHVLLQCTCYVRGAAARRTSAHGERGAPSKQTPCGHAYNAAGTFQASTPTTCTL